MTETTVTAPQGTGVKDTPSPNSPEAVAANPALDSNGNPVEQSYPVNGGSAPETPPAATAPTEPSTTPTGEESPTAPTVQYSDSQAEQLSGFIEAAELDVQKVMADVNSTGAIDPEIMESLVEKHGEAVANLIKDQMLGLASQRKAETAAQDKAVFDQVADAFKDVSEQSGKDTWKELSGWAKENVAADQRSEINGMLQQGGLTATLAVAHLVSEFKASDQFSQPAQLQDSVNVDNGNSFQPISAKEYTMKLRELEGKGHVYGQSQELARLDAQRTKSAQRGF